MTVLLPFPPDRLAGAPTSLAYEVWDGRTPLSDHVPGTVELYVQPYLVGRRAVDVIMGMSQLRVVQTLTAGVDHVAAAIPPGVLLCNARGVHDASTAELAVGLMIAALRGLPDFVHAHDRGQWAPTTRPALADTTVLLVGYGSIGQAVERRLAGFEVDVVRVAGRPRDGVHGTDELPALLPTADVVVLLVPLTEVTRGMVDGEFLARMRDGALLVNVARGPVVDTDALLAETASGRLRAALDVTDPEPLPADHPLWHAPGVLITPHVGGATSAMEPRMLALVADQLARYARGAELRNVVVDGDRYPST